MRIALISALILAAALLQPARGQDAETTAREAYEKGDYATALAGWRRAAQAGDAKAQVNLGHMYALGHGVGKDESAAMSWFRKAADQGSAVAHHNLGVMFETGAHKDLAAAARHYRIAAQAGWTASQTALGKLYKDGRGVVQDYKEAAKWLEAAAEDSDAEAQFLLGMFYANGWGVERDLGGMLEWIRRAARQGHPEALFHMGLAYDQGLGVGQNPANAARFYAVAAKKGEVRARTRLGEMYFRGIGIERNVGLAMDLLTAAAAEGDAPALFLLGLANYSGVGVARNPERGVAYWRRAADQGHPEALFRLGQACETGIGAARDPDAALEWYRRAADRGHIGADYAIGRTYAAGLGVAKDDAEAARWYLKAARGGHPEAQLAIARMYLDGVGVARNPQSGLRWINEAIRRGSRAALAQLAELHLTGNGVARDPDRALQLLREAAEKGLKSAQTRLADLLTAGRLVPADLERAAEWYRRLAEAGDAHGTAMLAAFHLKGRGGLAPDPKRAAELFRIAANLGSVYAADMLAALHIEGKGIGRDPVKAARWYARAAAAGDFAANYALGGMYQQGLGVGRDLDAAERHYAAALAIEEKRDGPSALSLVKPLRRLAELNHHRGRGDRAASYYRRAVEILGAKGDKATYLETLANLVAVYRDQRRLEDAAAAISLALESLESLGPGTEDTAAVFRLGLAELFEELDQDSRAAEIYGEVVAAMEKTGKPGPGYRYALASRGRVLANLGRNEAAEADLVRALVLMERHKQDGFAFQQAGALKDYGRLLVRLGQFGEAVATFEKSEKLIDGLGLSQHPRGLGAARDFALAYEKEGMIDSAVAVLGRAIRLGAAYNGPPARAAPRKGAESKPSGFDMLQQYLRLLTTPPVSRARRAEAFEVMQRLAFSNPSPLSRRLLARMIASDDGLARLLDARNQVLAARDRIARRLDGPEAGFGLVGDDVMKDGFRELRRLESKLDRLARTLQRRYPRAAALLSPPPIRLDAARALLDADEALVATYSAPEGTHVWVATAEGSRYYRMPLAHDEITRIVGRLRAGLETPRDPVTGETEPYPLELAASLYQSLFGPAETMLKRVTHVIHAPGGALRHLPLSVLVADLAALSADEDPDPGSAPADSEKSRFAAYREVVWFIDKFSYSRVPSPGVLRALRSGTIRRRAPNAFVGIGGPVLAERSKLADLAGIPQTVSPLRVMARRFDARDDDFHLEFGAEELAIKSMHLNKFRVIGFTTPGVVAGELPGVAEPSLVLKAQASESGEDGFLTASEIADLDLDAELVVLAMPRPRGAAGAAWQSALAEAFFHAGARSVMAADWPVERRATAAFAASMFARRNDGGAKRLAELTQRAALEVLSDETRPAHFAHPRYWGAFAIIGDGGRKL